MEKVRIYTRLLRVGQVIAGPAVDENGLLLIGGGTEVNEKNLYLLKMSGIESVEVKGDNYFKWQLYQSPEQKQKSVKEKFSTHKNRYMKVIEKALIDKIEAKKEEAMEGESE